MSLWDCDPKYPVSCVTHWAKTGTFTRHQQVGKFKGAQGTGWSSSRGMQHQNILRCKSRKVSPDKALMIPQTKWCKSNVCAGTPAHYSKQASTFHASNLETCFIYLFIYLSLIYLFNATEGLSQSTLYGSFAALDKKEKKKQQPQPCLKMSAANKLRPSEEDESELCKAPCPESLG